VGPAAAGAPSENWPAGGGRSGEVPGGRALVAYDMCHLQFPDTLATSRHPHGTGSASHSLGMPWISPPTLYKARHVPTKQPVCAICVDRTRGKTQRLQLTHRVAVWLCANECLNPRSRAGAGCPS